MRFRGRSLRGRRAASSPRLRLASMLTLLLLIGILYQRARDPLMWTWLEEGEPEPAPSAQVVQQQAQVQSTRLIEQGDVIVPGPTNDDPGEQDEAKREFAALADNAPLVSFEMLAYYRCLRWANAETFAALESRAQRDVPLTKLYEEPDKHRGELIRLRLNINRVIEWDAPEDRTGVKKVYEAWGWTDESKSHPYVVVFSALPPGLKVGTDVSGRGVFVGYFLKYMAYTAFDRRRSAPLLIGRMEGVPMPTVRPAPATDWLAVGIVVGMFCIVIVASVWLRSRSKKGRRPPPMSQFSETAEDPEWFDGSGGSVDVPDPEARGVSLLDSGESRSES